jgi:hypothetical protein
MTITLTREEAQQVLDALKEIYWPKEHQAHKTIESLRARLAQPEPEPDTLAGYRLACSYGVFESRAFDLADKFRELYTAPLQREWQGLTDEEIKLFWSRSLADT